MLRNRIYYRVKPFIPPATRIGIRRWLALRKRQRLEETWPILRGSECVPKGWPGWPEGKQFALVLTHDVESKVGLDNCQPLIQLERRSGFRSAFNFVPEGDYKVSRNLRDELANDGFEIGIHDLRHDGSLYRSRVEFSRDASRINQYLEEWGAVGFRSAFMLHKLDWLHELNIEYDASTFDTDPFEPQPEGRHTIFPFWVSRPISAGSKASANRTTRSGYVELPYTLPQDSTLFVLLQEKTPDIWYRKLDWIAEHGGMALIDTHPDYMASNGGSRHTRDYPIELYQQLLDYIRSNYAGAYWHALPKQVAAHVVQSATGLTQRGAVSSAAFAEATCSTNLQGASKEYLTFEKRLRLRGKRAAVLLFSYYPADPRPRRAAEALAKEGVVVDLICLRESQTQPARETINGVNILRVRQKRYRGDKRRYARQYATFILKSFIHLTIRSLTKRYDFVHVHNMPDVLVFSALVPKMLGAKIILDLHDPMPELMQAIFRLPEKSLSVRMLKRLEKWSIGFADLAVTVNLACKKIYSSRSCAPEKITVVLNSPDDDIFRFQPPRSRTSNGSNPGRPFVILYHGSLVRRNGFDLAVDALEIVRRSIPSAKLTVCGERTAFFEEVMDSARQRGLQEIIQYLGARNLNQIVEAIQNCDLGIIPNHRNIFTEINTPTRIFEYLALGKPVIAPQARGIQDYFADGELVFFKLGDARDLAQKIEFAFFHPKDVEETVKRGQQVYLSHNWSEEKLTLLNSIGGLL